MGILLDPFQQIVRLSFPQKLELVGLGTITQADVFFSYVLQCTCEALALGACNDFKPWASYQTAWDTGNNLSSPIDAAEQCDYVIEGQSSGIKTYMGGQERVEAGLVNCFWRTSSSVYTANGGVSAYNATVDKHRVAGQVYDLAPRGYTVGEAINIFFTKPSAFSITQILFRNTHSIYVDAPLHGQSVGDWIDIQGTEDYDGYRQIDGIVDAGRFYITELNAYVKDNFGGQYERIFDHA